MVNELLLCTLQDEGHDHDEDNQEDDDGRAVALVALCKSVIIEQVNDGLRIFEREVRLVHYHEHQIEDRQSADDTGLYRSEEASCRERV